MLHRAGSKHLAEEQHAQPAGALADHLAEADVQVRCIQRLDAAELLHVLVGFGDQRIEHVVHGDDAEHAAARPAPESTAGRGGGSAAPLPPGPAAGRKSPAD
jgi:hypothetical protein